MKKKVFWVLTAIFSLSLAMLAGCNGGFPGAGAGTDFGTKSDCAHEYVELLTLTEPTCTSEGESVKICRICKSSEIVTLDKLEHTEEVIPAVEATCIAEGLTEGKKCSSCGEILVAQQKTAKTTTHRMNVYQTLGAATCTEDGNSLCVCQDCNTYVYVLDKALGHDLIYNVSENDEGKNLSVSFNCRRSLCDYSGSLSGITKIKMTKAPTCAEFGAADLTLNDGTSLSVTTIKHGNHTLNGKEIDLTEPIDYQEGINFIGPSTKYNCTSTTADAFFRCDKCEMYFTLNVVNFPHSGVPNDFDYTNEENYKSPTPTESGFIKYSCAECGKNIEKELPAHTHELKFSMTITTGAKQYLIVTCNADDCPLNCDIESIFSDKNSLLYKNCVIDISGVVYLNDNGEIIVNQELALSKGLTLSALSGGGFEVTISAPEALACFNVTQPITGVIYYYVN